MNLSSYPLVRPCVAFALGIVSYHYLGELVRLPMEFVVLGILVFVFLCYKNTYKLQYLLAGLLIVLFFGLGANRLQEFKSLDEKEQFVLQDTIAAYTAVVIEAPSPKANSVLVSLKVRSIYNGQKWQKSIGYVNAYIPKNDLLILPKSGDQVFIKGSPLLVSGPANPGEFNYKQYLVYNRIYHQHYLKNGLSIIGTIERNKVIQLADRLREKCIYQINIYLNDQDAKSVVKALSLGVKDDLQDELINAFSSTGAMHVLAVSGLHVGIIYGLIFLLFKKLGLDKRKYRYIVALLSLAMLWFYALLTGLSPSVLRAVTMFSFVALGKALFKKGNIYNTLAASALFLLWINPYLIMSVGFQLSYLAVFGIVWLHPKFYALVSTDNYILDKVWAITCVSIAAQLATAPLSLLYFHKFPNYFLLSNLFIIPAAFVILLGSLLLFAVSFSATISFAVGFILNELVKGVNQLVFWVGNWPYAVKDGVHLTILETWLIYAVLISLKFLFSRHKMKWLYMASIFSLCFTVSRFSSLIPIANSSEFSILDVSNSEVYDFRVGFSGKLISDLAFLNDLEKQRFHLHQKRMIQGVNHDITEDSMSVPSMECSLGQIITFQGKSILVLKERLTLYDAPEIPLGVDYLILTASAERNHQRISKFINAKHIISGNSYSRYSHKLFLESLPSNQIAFHSMNSDGYFSHLWRK